MFVAYFPARFLPLIGQKGAAVLDVDRSGAAGFYDHDASDHLTLTDITGCFFAVAMTLTVLPWLALPGAFFA